MRKNTTLEKDELYEYPYYIARILKRRLFTAQCSRHRFRIEELDNASSIQFEGEGYVEQFQCHFRLADLPRDALYPLATPVIQD